MKKETKKFVFGLRTPFYFRNLAPVAEELLRRGHHVVVMLGWVNHKEDIALRQLSNFQERFSNFQIVEMPHEKKRDRLELLWCGAIDRLHFRRPVFRKAPVFAQRTVAKMDSAFLDGLEKRKAYRRFPLRPLLLQGFRYLLDALPPLPELEEMIGGMEPDLFVVCPLIDVGFPQFGMMQAAQARKVRTAFIVHSWDNLSSKSWICLAPDSILVWNDFQRDELARFHGLRKSRALACGAPGFDVWIDRPPPADRAAFLTGLGLDPDRPTFLFVGSATYPPPFGDEWEIEYLKSWLSAVRSCPHPEIREANVLVRPHPKRYGDLVGFDLSGLGPIKIWPEQPENPATAETRATFYRSVICSDAVVGINTSAFLDAAVIGRPVFTILDPRFRTSQEGTLHFRMLLGTGRDDGLLRTARSFDEHIEGLRNALATGSALTPAEHAFLEKFVRPAGWHKRASEVLCDRLEAEAMQPFPKPAVHAVLRRKLLKPVNVKMIERVKTMVRRRNVRKELGTPAPRPGDTS